MTRRQSNNQWRGGIAAHPAPPQKIPSAKIRWKSSRLNFLGSRRHPPRWLPSKGLNYQRGVLLISDGANEGHFEGKTPLECLQGGFVLARHFPGSPATCGPEETGLPGLSLSWSPPYSPDLAPSDYHLFPGLKKQLKCRHFRPTLRSLLSQRPGWTDNLTNILSGLQTLEKRTKKSNELRGEYVE